MTSLSFRISYPSRNKCMSTDQNRVLNKVLFSAMKKWRPLYLKLLNPQLSIVNWNTCQNHGLHNKIHRQGLSLDIRSMLLLQGLYFFPAWSVLSSSITSTGLWFSRLPYKLRKVQGPCSQEVGCHSLLLFSLLSSWLSCAKPELWLGLEVKSTFIKQALLCFPLLAFIICLSWLFFSKICFF